MPSSDAAELGNGNTPGLVSQKKSCYGKDSDESNGLTDKRIGIGVGDQSDSNLSDGDINDSSVEEDAENYPAQNAVRNETEEIRWKRF